MNKIVVVDVIREVVGQLKGFTPAPYYMHGHPQEIVNIMSQKAKSDSSKTMFPLIALFQDFEEDIATGFFTANLNIIIANRTKPEYTAAERYEKNFRPVLYPILEMFERALKVNRMVESIEFEYTKIDHVFWGKEGLYGSEANIFNDFIDAIELKNLNVEFKNYC